MCIAPVMPLRDEKAETYSQELIKDAERDGHDAWIWISNTLFQVITRLQE